VTLAPVEVVIDNMYHFLHNRANLHETMKQGSRVDQYRFDSTNTTVDFFLFEPLIIVKFDEPPFAIPMLQS